MWASICGYYGYKDDKDETAVHGSMLCSATISVICFVCFSIASLLYPDKLSFVVASNDSIWTFYRC